MTLIKRLALGAALALATAVSAAAPDLAREQRMADEIVDAILDGDPVELQADGHNFMGIYTEADEPKGTVVILHGRGFHPDWSTVIQPLRVGLVEHGWNTLSIQMPVLEKSAKYNDYVPIFPASHGRIESALNYVRENSEGKVILLAHSCGSHMAHNWVHSSAQAASLFDAFVGVGMGATDYKQPMVEPFALDKMKMPLLDLYGEQDYPAVIRMAAEREAMIKKAGNPKSSQQVLAGADHYFVDKGDELVEAVAGWLDTL